jgi:lipopolysaccharide biosynthesis glycosyltransferase
MSSIKFLAVTNHLDNIVSAKKGMYHRLLLPQMLPDLDKIIYTDVDLIFNCDLQELDKIDISKYYVAGVKDFYKNKGNFRSKIWSEYGLYDISDKGQYINTGVLVINLKKIRQDGIDKKWFQLANNISFPYHDQDIINVSCADNILLLSNDYNFTGDNSKILHYAGPNKPWNAYDGILKYSELWWYYADQTPFHLYFLKSAMQKQCENMFKVLPKWLGKVFCWFIPKRESRHRFFDKYVKIT